MGSDLEAGSGTRGLGRAQEWAESEIGGGGAWANGPRVSSSRGDRRFRDCGHRTGQEKKPNSAEPGRRLGGACVRLAAVQEIERSAERPGGAAAANAEVKPGGGGRRAVVCS